MKFLTFSPDFSLPAVAPFAAGRWLTAQFQAERGRWLLWVPVFIGIGVWLYFELPFEPSRLGLAATPLLAGLCLTPRLRRARLFLTLALLIVMGVNAGQIATWRMSYPMLKRDFGPVPVAGRVVAIDPQADGMSIQLDQISIDKLPPEATPQQVRIRLRAEDMVWPPIGSRITLSARLTSPREPAAPGAYDFRRHAFFNGIGAQGFSRGAPQIIAPPAPNGLLPGVENLRATIAARVLHHLPGDTAQIAIALLNGAQSGISKPALETMRASGLQHILSISGLHLAIVAAFVFVGLRGLLALWPYAALHWPVKKIAAGLSLLNLAAYTLLVGAPVPAVRSAIMTGIVMIAVLFDRRALSLRTVALAAMILLLAVPQALTGASFQMSFAAVTVMVAGYEALRRIRRQQFAEDRPHGGWRRAILGHIGGIALTSLLAAAATAPLTLHNFQQMNWYGVIANMLGIPLTAFWIMPAGFLAYILMPFGLEGVAVQCMGLGIEGLMLIAAQVGSWPGAMIRIAAPPAYALPLILLGGLWLCLWQRHWRFLGVVPLLLGLLANVAAAPPDLYIAPDFANWAVRDHGGDFIALKAGARDFTIMQWRQREGGRNFTARDAVRDDPDAALQCDARGCLYTAKGRRISIAETAAAVHEDCARVDMLVTPLWHVRCPDGSAAPIIIDGAWIKRHGAAAIRLDAAAPPAIRSTRSSWRARPWTPGWRPED